MDLRELERFILVAREHTCLGQGHRLPPERPGAVEIVYREGGLTYRDSYFGRIRVIGQEIVRHAGNAIWGMNYLIVTHELPIPSEELAAFLQRAQLARYRERRLLGPHIVQERHLRYEDHNEGNLERFTGLIRVLYGEEEIYRMDYAGGLIR